MSIPFNNNITWDSYKTNPEWHENLPKPKRSPAVTGKNLVGSVASELFKQLPKRGMQFIRDGARLVLKVPIRSLATPVFLKKNWKQRERAKINAKLAGYSFVQLFSVPVKFLVAIAALATLAVSYKKAKALHDLSEKWTANLDGRTSQLEALKEEGRKRAITRVEYNEYKEWLYSIDPKLCRAEG